MSEIEELQKEIEVIKVRNKRVEADKAWETSFTRKLVITFSTYVLIALVMAVLQVPQPLLSAVVPAAGYLLSTLSWGIVKNWWLKSKKI